MIRAATANSVGNIGNTLFQPQKDIDEPCLWYLGKNKYHKFCAEFLFVFKRRIKEREVLRVD
jgi:hypothetical protein